MVSLPVSVGVGLLVLLAALPILGALMAGSFEDLPVMLEGLLRGMRRGL
jgi:flagellar biosynthesis protein FliR